MRSSSEVSQLTEYTSRSRLPSWRDPTRLFCAHSELPTTTKRPCPPENVPAAASVCGPFLPLLGSTAPFEGTELTATASSLVATSIETEVLSPFLTSSER